MSDLDPGDEKAPAASRAVEAGGRGRASKDAQHRRSRRRRRQPLAWLLHRAAVHVQSAELRPAVAETLAALAARLREESNA